jgi:hypothetical protein
MKKLILFALLMVSLTTFSQTTLEEYNYITKGYKIQLESGLDMKKGYSLSKVNTAKQDDRNITIYSVFKETQEAGTKLVAYMLEYEKKGKPKEYYCIPHPSSETNIKDLFFNSLSNNWNDTAPKLILFVGVLSSIIKWN